MKQHRQGPGGEHPRLPSGATQPGGPGAASSTLANTSPRAAPGICSSCGHDMAMSRCWRLTCPSNGAGISSQLVYDRAVAKCASAARMVMRSSLFDPEPPEKAYVGLDLASGPDLTAYWVDEEELYRDG